MASIGHKRRIYRNHFLTFLLIANSGLPFFTNEPLILLGSLMLTALYINTTGLQNKFFLMTIVFLMILVLGQTVTTGLFSLRATITLFIRWTYPFVVLLVLREEFTKTYVNVLYFLTIFSFILFIPSIFFPQFDVFLTEASSHFEQTSKSDFYRYKNNLLIYTVYPTYAMDGSMLFKRNSGPFWEPGAFGSYLLVAIIFNLLHDKKLLSKKNTVFFIALLTTWSTASFIALFLVLSLYVLWMYKKNVSVLLIVPVILYLAVTVYEALPFFSERVDRSVEYFQQRDHVEYERRDRMVSAIVDLRTFSEHPIFGTGRDPQARFSGTGFRTYLEHRNNGITDFLVKYGIFFFIFYFYNIYLGFKKLSLKNGGHEPTKYGILALIGIVIIGFSQVLFQQSVFIALFYQAAFIKNNVDESNKRKYVPD